MSENATRDRSWRVDLTRSSSKTESPSGSGSPAMEGVACDAPGEAAPAVSNPIRKTLRGLRQWGRLFRGVAQPRGRAAGSSESSAEAIIHDFAESVSMAIDPAVVASRLVQAAKKMTGAYRVELAFDSAIEISTDLFADEQDKGVPPSKAVLGPPLAMSVSYGAQHWGALRLIGIPARRWNRGRVHPPIRALKTLCTLAAMAFEGISTSQLFDSLGSEGPDEVDVEFEGEAVATSTKQGPSSLRDATYLHVILPYALSQSHRHREPVSILYAGIDRLSAIHEMLGPEHVTRALNHVGEIISNRIRASDVVSRMEDDRILVMLPNATASNTCRIASEIRSLVEESCRSLPDLPPLTVSIGIASFPTHSRDVYSLLNAADEAMSAAQEAGRNRVVVAGNKQLS